MVKWIGTVNWGMAAKEKQVRGGKYQNVSCWELDPNVVYYPRSSKKKHKSNQTLAAKWCESFKKETLKICQEDQQIPTPWLSTMHARRRHRPARRRNTVRDSWNN